jgi:hypothetical protein
VNVPESITHKHIQNADGWPLIAVTDIEKPGRKGI